MSMATRCTMCHGRGCPQCHGLGWENLVWVKLLGVAHIVADQDVRDLKTHCSRAMRRLGYYLSTDLPKRRCRACVAAVRAEGKRLGAMDAAA